MRGLLEKKGTPSFEISNSQAREIEELIHSDLCSLMETDSVGNSKYFLLFKHNFSNYRKLYFLRNKFEDCFTNFIKCMKNKTGKNIKTIRTDNNLEFVKKEIKAM